MLAVVVFTILVGIAIYLGHQVKMKYGLYKFHILENLKFMAILFQHANGLLCQRGDYHCEADETDRTKKKAIKIGKLALPVPSKPGKTLLMLSQ